jgi:transcriptional regulatory protein RtcR
MPPKKTVVLGILGTKLDAGSRNRWDRWRPTVDLCRHEAFVVDRLEVLHEERWSSLAGIGRADGRSVSPETEVVFHQGEMGDPWDFEGVYAYLHDFASTYDWKPEEEEYLVHITTGTHVAQICWFLLTESRRIPARLIQTSPPRRAQRGRAAPVESSPGEQSPGEFTIIDLDLSRYDRIARRFAREQSAGLHFLKDGIPTRNGAFNQLIERIERVAVASPAPILLQGPTGAGKSRLARRIYELKRLRSRVVGAFVEVNCATIRGDAAMSSLFGHVKGAFTGAQRDRPGLLRTADGGVLFLDEIAELGPDEQAMLLRALEEKTFLPVGADGEVESDFQLIAGTNRDLDEAVAAGRFRDDLLARINLWTFHLPGLAGRMEDIEPNVDYELTRFREATGRTVRFNKEARDAFLRFATGPDAVWAGNFRDLNAAITRLATLAEPGRISVPLVREEIGRLRAAWTKQAPDRDAATLLPLIGRDAFCALDRFDRVQLAEVVRVVSRTTSLSAAGRELFAASRARKKSANDADRLRKYLVRHGVLDALASPGVDHR